MVVRGAEGAQRLDQVVDHRGAGGLGEIVHVPIVVVEGRAAHAGLFGDIGHADLGQVPHLDEFDQGALQRRRRGRGRRSARYPRLRRGRRRQPCRELAQRTRHPGLRPAVLPGAAARGFAPGGELPLVLGHPRRGGTRRPGKGIDRQCRPRRRRGAVSPVTARAQLSGQTSTSPVPPRFSQSSAMRVCHGGFDN